MAMRKISLVILAGVALFALGVAGVLILRGRTIRVDPTEVSPTKADYRIKEVHLQEEGSDNLNWTLDADHAEIFDRDGKIVLRGVTITIEEPDRSWRVTADEGDVVQPAKDVTIRRNVVLVSSDGIRLETDILRWQAKEKRIWTEAPVTFYRRGIVVTGRGLDTHLAEERASVKGPVRAIFTRVRSGPASGAVADPGQAR